MASGYASLGTPLAQEPASNYANLGTPVQQQDQQPLQAPAPVPQGQDPFFDQGYYDNLMKLENRPLSMLPNSWPVKPNQSPEGANNFDIGYGHKITPQEWATKMIHGIPFPGKFTNAEAKEVLKYDMATQWEGARKEIGEGFDSLPLGAQILMTDYNFTGVLDKFPKFRKAVTDNDWDAAEKEYVRYMTDKKGNKVPLGTRNTFAFKELQKLRASTGFSELGTPIESPSGLTAESPDTALPSSPYSGTSSDGDFSFSEYYDKWKSGDFSREDAGDVYSAGLRKTADIMGVPEGAGEAMGSFVSNAIPFAVGWAKELPAAIGGSFKSGLIDKELEEASHASREFAEEYTFQPRTEEGEWWLEKAMVPFEAIYTAKNKIVTATGGGEREIAATDYILDGAMLLLPGHMKRAKTKVQKRKAIEAAVKEFAAVAEKKKEMVDIHNPEAVAQGVAASIAMSANAPDVPLARPKAKNSANQAIADRLIDEAQERNHESINQTKYREAAEVIARLDEVVADADLSAIGRSKIKKLVDKLAKAQAEGKEFPKVKKKKQQTFETPDNLSDAALTEIDKYWVEQIPQGAVYKGTNKSGKHVYETPDGFMQWNLKDPIPEGVQPQTFLPDGSPMMGKAKRRAAKELPGMNETPQQGPWGEVTINEKLIVEELRKLDKEVRRSGQTPEQVLAESGLAPEAQQQMMRALKDLPELDKRVRFADVTENLINPEEGFSIPMSNRHKINGKKVDVKKPGMTQSDLNLAGELNKFEKPKRWYKRALRNMGKVYDITEIRPNAMEKFSPKLKKLLFDPWVTAKATAKREVRRIEVELNKDIKNLSKKDIVTISAAALARQEHGPKAVAASMDKLAKHGIKEIPKFEDLLPEHQALVEKWGGVLAATLERQNYMRRHTGLKPIGKIKDYFPFIHQLNEMHRAGLVKDLAALELEGVKGQSKNFQGTLFPYENRRLGSRKAIDLDIFEGTRKYMRQAIEGIHVNPVASKAKSMAQYLRETNNPKHKNQAASHLLDKWSDEITGQDALMTRLRKDIPTLATGITALQKNIAIATLFGTVSTAIKQPLALLGTVSETSVTDVLHGIRKALAEDPFKVNPERAARRKFAANEIRQIDIFMDMAQDIAGGKVTGVRNLAAKAAAYPMTLMDSFSSDVTAFAGENFAKKMLGKNEAGAMQFANDLVNRTQGLGIKGAVSPIQATAATKWATIFQTFAINDFNYIARDLLGFRNPNKNSVKQVYKVLKYSAAAAYANYLFDQLGLDAPKPEPFAAYKETIEEGGMPQEAMAEGMLELIEMYPLVGGAIKFDSSVLGAVAEYAKKLPEAARAALNFMVGVPKLDWSHMSEKEKFYQGMLIGETLGKTLGIPMTNQLKKSIRAASRTDDPVKIIVGAYVDTNEAKKNKPLLQIGPESRSRSRSGGRSRTRSR